MKPRVLGRVLAAYALLLAAWCLGLYVHVKESPPPPETARVVRSRWMNGAMIQRVVEPAGSPSKAGMVEEEVVAEGPMWKSPLLFAMALVAGKDGVRAELDGKTEWVTADDLLSAGAYDHGTTVADQLGLGTSKAIVMDLLAKRLGAPVADVEARAVLHRVRFARKPAPGGTLPKRITADTIDRATVTDAIGEAARYLARGVNREGRYRYLVDAATDKEIAGYNWPRHAGSTYFLAQAAAMNNDAVVRAAAMRAANLMRDEMLKDCGDQKCIAEGPQADVGSSALGLIAFAELARTKADASYKNQVVALAKFLESVQRPDGEFMHLYDRTNKKPIDVQLLYYTGEAALALSRAHRITGDPADLAAAQKALDRLSGSGWSFFGSRYYFSEEHWTCQAVADLWDRAPNQGAADFCLRWHEYQRAIQQSDDDSPFEADGAFNVGPFITPRVTPVSSRGEAAVAALEYAKKRGESPATIAALEREIRRALGFILRNQFRPGPTHLFASPSDVRGAIPGSPVDWQLRIDYEQHAGSMMVRFLEVLPPPS